MKAKTICNWESPNGYTIRWVQGLDACEVLKTKTGEKLKSCKDVYEAQDFIENN